MPMGLDVALPDILSNRLSEVPVLEARANPNDVALALIPLIMGLIEGSDFLFIPRTSVEYGDHRDT
jgi:hypothetical protein